MKAILEYTITRGDETETVRIGTPDTEDAYVVYRQTAAAYKHTGWTVGKPKIKLDT